MAMEERDEGARERWMTELVNRWERPLIDYARRWLRTDAAARDVVQETFLRAWRAPNLEAGPVERARAFLYTVTRNACVDQLRLRKDGEGVPDFAPRALTDPHEKLDRRERAGRVLAKLAGLPARQQELLRLKLVDGLSYREIAGVTGLSVTNVGFLLHVSLAALQAEVNPS